MEAILSSETPVLTRAQEDGIVTTVKTLDLTCPEITSTTYLNSPYLWIYSKMKHTHTHMHTHMHTRANAQTRKRVNTQTHTKIYMNKLFQ
jgi:hypothetical protein